MKSIYDNNYTKAHRNTAAKTTHVYSRHNEYSTECSRPKMIQLNILWAKQVINFTKYDEMHEKWTETVRGRTVL